MRKSQGSPFGSGDRLVEGVWIGAKRAASVGLAIVCIGYGIAMTAALPLVAIGARVVTGVGTAVCFVVGADMVRQHAAGPVALGIFGGMTTGAGGAAVFVVPALAPVLGWRTAWATCGAIAASALLAVARWHPGPGAHPTSSRHAPRPLTSAPLWRDRELNRLAGVHGITLGIGVVLSNWAALILQRAWHMAPGTAALIGSLILLGAIVSRPLGGLLAPRVPRHLRLVTALSLVASATGTLLLGGTGGPWIAVLAVIVLGVATGLPFSAVLGAAQARRPDRPAAAVGLLNGYSNGLIVVGTPLFGAAMDQSMVTLALVITAGIGLVPVFALPRSLSQQFATGLDDLGSHPHHRRSTAGSARCSEPPTPARPSHHGRP